MPKVREGRDRGAAGKGTRARLLVAVARAHDKFPHSVRHRRR